MPDRLDQRLVQLGLARSRAQAQALIKAGKVSIENAVVNKPAFSCPDDLTPTVSDSGLTRYVSRGGIKLQGALITACIDVSGMTILDIGQSTGGFTDCLLQAGATKVVGVDVGRDQLVASLKQDQRVVCYEGINGRELPAKELLSHAPVGFNGVVMDVSFISQTLIYPSLIPLIGKGGFLLSLVKPQFELQPAQVGKGGIVRDKTLYAQVETRIRASLTDAGLAVSDYFDSPIEGGDGNREFFVFACKA